VPWFHLQQLFKQYDPPLWKQISMMIVFPIACLAAGILVFIAPFAEVEDGVSANWVHFLALGYGAWLVYQVPVALILALTRIPMSWRTTVVVTLPGGVLMSLLAWGIPFFSGVYPFKFVPITCGFPGFLLSLFLTYRALPRSLRTLRRVRMQLIAAVIVSVLTLVVMACWAFHRLGFATLADDGLWQSAFTLLLPLMKFSFRCVLRADACLRARKPPCHCVAPTRTDVSLAVFMWLTLLCACPQIRWVFGRVAMLADPDMGPVLVFVVEYFNSIFTATLMADTNFMSGVLLVTCEWLGLGQQQGRTSRRLVSPGCSHCMSRVCVLQTTSLETSSCCFSYGKGTTSRISSFARM